MSKTVMLNVREDDYDVFHELCKKYQSLPKPFFHHLLVDHLILISMGPEAIEKHNKLKKQFILECAN